MRKIASTHLMLVGGAALLAACSDGATAPTPLPPNASLGAIASSSSGCWQLQRGGVSGGLNETSVGRGSLTLGGPTMPVIVITATFFPSFGGNWITDQMRFPSSAPYHGNQCINDPYSTFRAETLLVALDPELAPPEGVDADWWTGLSARERRVLLDLAQKVNEMYPGSYPGGVSQIINEVIRPRLNQTKARAKIATLDFAQGSEGELFYGAVYGCMLYNSFARDPDSFLLNDDAAIVAGQLVRAWAETQYASAPNVGLVVGANGTHGALIAHRFPTDNCGSSMFQRIGNGIRIEFGTTPRGPGTGSGRPGGPQVDPDALPPGWMPTRASSR